MVMRNWVPEDRKAGLDAIIKAARVHGTPPSNRPSIQVRELLMSERDGAGAQSIFDSVKQGRRHALVAILIKQGHGIRDAWVASPLDKGEADGMLAHVTTEMPHHEATAEDVALLVGAALADGAAGEVPPFGLVQAAGLIALPDVAPSAVTVTDLIAALIADADPASVSDEAMSDALRASGRWLQRSSNVQSWFENGDDVAAARRGKRKKADRIAAIVREVLEPRRAFWAQVVAWSAFACRGGGDDAGWVDMSLVARELAGNRPLTDIPVAMLVAAQTDAAAMV